MLPDDDKRYAIETCRSSESVLKKLFKNKWHTISEFVGCVIINILLVGRLFYYALLATWIMQLQIAG